MAMKTMKAWLAAVLALALVLGMSGCLNREPTAKELMAGIPTIDPEKYCDMAIEAEITTETDGRASDISMSFGIESSGSIMHIYDVDLSLGVNGLSVKLSMEGWMESAEKTTYARMTIFGEDTGWMALAPGFDSEVFPAESFRKMAEGTSSLNETNAGFVLEPHTEGEDHVVTWTANGAETDGLSDLFGGLLGGFAADDQTPGADQLDFSTAAVQAHFDEETHDLKFIRVEADATDPAGSKSTVVMAITYNTVNGAQELNIPPSVIETATDVSSLQ